jgi:hypothetical protein
MNTLYILNLLPLIIISLVVIFTNYYLFHKIVLRSTERGRDFLILIITPLPIFLLSLTFSSWLFGNLISTLKDIIIIFIISYIILLIQYLSKTIQTWNGSLDNYFLRVSFLPFIMIALLSILYSQIPFKKLTEEENKKTWLNLDNNMIYKLSEYNNKCKIYYIGRNTEVINVSCKEIIRLSEYNIGFRNKDNIK